MKKFVGFLMLNAFGIFSSLFLGGCALQSHEPLKFEQMYVTTPGFVENAVTPASVAKFGDKYFVVTREFKYRILATNEVIIVPAGFVTDLASVPRVLWSFGLSPIDSYMNPAILHDYLYWDQRCSKEEADSVLGLAMYEGRVNPVKMFAVYRAVSLFGKSSFSENEKLKKSGESRFFTDRYTETILDISMDASINLASIMRNARKVNGVSDGAEINPNIKMSCRIADEEFKKL